jgi:hypothetical protein
VSDYVDFDSRDDAEKALETLEDDLVGSADGIVVVSSARQRLSFLRGDFRRTKLFKDDGPLVF